MRPLFPASFELNARASTLCDVAASIGRILGLLAAALAALLHVWYRGVLAAPEVKRRKAARRSARPEGRPLTRASAARRV